ncbi:MAG: exonuclease domain-containing protein [Pseudomonadota bacterium]
MALSEQTKAGGLMPFFVPALGLSTVLAVVAAAAAFSDGLASILMPVLALLSVAVVGTIIALKSRVEQSLYKPAKRLEEALSAVPERGVSHLSGMREPGMLVGVIREASALFDARTNLSSDDALAREAAVRGRLETVLRDLHDGVLICTLDHQVLLYNKRALDIMHITGGVGLDRSLFETLSPRPFRHALTRLKARLKNNWHIGHRDGLSAPVIASTLDGRHTLRGRMSLMLDDAGATAVGYVVTFEDVTDSLRHALWRERALFDLRADLTTRLESLLSKSDGHELAAEIDELRAEVDRLDDLLLDVVSSAWPMSAMFSTTLFECVAERDSEGRNLQFSVEGDPVWLHCDSASIADLIDRLANRLAVQTGEKSFRLIATMAQGEKVFIDLLCAGSAPEEPVVAEWLDEPIEADLGAATVRDILQRHRTDLSISSIDGPAARIRLPLALAGDHYERSQRSYMPAAPRAEFYDFDLLHRPHVTDFDEVPLSALTAVVFDTETTGLEPSKGDEIISIGAARIVNGRLLRGEIFNEFVNPGRRIPAVSSKVHGITDAMVAEAPSVLETLPRFHRFVGESALIAHNAAFDMKFLALKENETGVQFQQPVLDTLLLAAHALGREDSLSLDALADRFGITLPPEDRHTALGDAIATGRVFLKLLPILQSSGITTLKQAMDASDKQVGLRRMQEQF